MDRQVFVAASVLAIAAALVYGAFLLTNSVPLTILLVVLLAAAASFSPRLVEFKEYERGVLFSFGKFKRVVGPGWVMILPAIHSYEKVDLRTQHLDIPMQDVITNDEIRLKLDAVVFLKIVDPKKAVLEIKDLQKAISQLLFSEIRNRVNKMPLEEVLESTEQINEAMRETLKKVEDSWGIKTVEVKVQDIALPEKLARAMQERKEALEYKAKLETEANARRVAINVLDEATRKMDDKTFAYMYLETLKRVADGRSSKIIFPMELSKLAESIGGKLAGNKQVDYSAVVSELSKSFAHQKKAERTAKPEKEAVKPVKSVEKPPKPVK
ncbi:hypothetical protein COX85_00290 [Candidatus Micrarchaeota archaeon CG_4_10_14_0_2_um_filter_55_9]|nr:MAG: hypothetical protein AUJ15_01285 [Candidatus Micrarchaeota archaeon CG1_02_55_41]PIO02519.1 MAG: hypothetical protein COT57_03515 [Candidatus Micrarchaeota archaeon CG09_land_8_20_14_0_10_55_25]PIZ92113.1 MAG: hypothetical protein COX85_00290 [Candidatus Micrarchaeota archaeon CG_4_10_14_0_2_um_filter_55_9]PJD01093.1 MAG: hypothetical protein COU38_02740 [Candidatus Micrarchaeota archaeon CG10_big_fil_rev_8_21_14_0_10_54_18]